MTRHNEPPPSDNKNSNLNDQPTAGQPPADQPPADQPPESSNPEDDPTYEDLSGIYKELTGALVEAAVKPLWKRLRYKDIILIIILVTAAWGNAIICKSGGQFYVNIMHTMLFAAVIVYILRRREN